MKLNIKKLYKTPCPIFECENFLNENLYLDLKKSFNSTNDFAGFTDFTNGKFAISSDDKLYDVFIKENSSAKIFHDMVFSKKFFNFFFKKFYFDFLKSRMVYPKHLIKLLRIPKITRELNKKSVEHYLSFFTNYKIDIQYSMIKNLGKIVPHTDSGEKILTLMIYFPDSSNEIEEKYGTAFWTSDTENFINIHQKNNLETEFKKKSKIFYKSKFKPNLLVGFVKNNFSWHSVEPINVSENYIRKSININITF